ncbi:hypothetical protein F6S87_02640 [Bifidobacterium sp. BRDM6]|uniref:Uncharacterized protein n=1 Tax=Bifidobacterium choloepi TaxID=2614131 RepID=A0A6I5MY56_9BIFI|nr:hypothetical protein [Bifidobacterium choloepi]
MFIGNPLFFMLSEVACFRMSQFRDRITGSRHAKAGRKDRDVQFAVGDYAGGTNRSSRQPPLHTMKLSSGATPCSRFREDDSTTAIPLSP